MTTTSIYGSCVARDTAALKSGAWKIANYTARQSMISAVSGRASVEGSIDLESAFQTRMVQADIAGTALEDLQKVSEDSAAILIDIMDERLGVYAAGNAYLTKTWELEKSGILQHQTPPLRHIEFATDEHFDLWFAAAQQVAAAVASYDVPGIVLAPPLADHDLDGDPLDYMGASVESWNQRFDRYYTALEQLGLTVLRPPATLAVADKAHQWGLAPFHYAPQMYEWFIAEIERAIAEHRAQRA
ncbi:DUF6270 domain-containing protein [Agrococcus casei]|uniref:Uncharacterized protein n=1 Tax=Agrococcus casei LMG 22410 TaxID=1255656 RepID=A0A1R4FBE9_9MICO|nr:DUF6270 domain-containing protein [Agrococcus casei]SJM53290.1 hypothetical protein CZ674_03725 [Agrococcus casei LMG 22410]